MENSSAGCKTLPYKKKFRQVGCLPSEFVSNYKLKPVAWILCVNGCGKMANSDVRRFVGLAGIKPSNSVILKATKLAKPLG